MSPTRPSDDQIPDDTGGSPLRGDLQDNALDGALHDMGGDIGAASDATAAADPSQPSQGLQQAQTRAVESGSVAVDSPAPVVGRDDADDAAGGDASGSPHAAGAEPGTVDDPREVGHA